jgi:hypothetical protein
MAGANTLMRQIAFPKKLFYVIVSLKLLERGENVANDCNLIPGLRRQRMGI